MLLKPLFLATVRSIAALRIETILSAMMHNSQDPPYPNKFALPGSLRKNRAAFKVGIHTNES